jgi:hypothetical protein
MGACDDVEGHAIKVLGDRTRGACFFSASAVPSDGAGPESAACI